MSISQYLASRDRIAVSQSIFTLFNYGDGTWNQTFIATVCCQQRPNNSPPSVGESWVSPGGWRKVNDRRTPYFWLIKNLARYFSRVIANRRDRLVDGLLTQFWVIVWIVLNAWGSAIQLYQKKVGQAAQHPGINAGSTSGIPVVPHHWKLHAGLLLSVSPWFLCWSSC